jgi:importin subunit beta-1
MSSLGTEQTRPSTAAQVLSTIAVAELPHSMWPDVMSQLDSLLRHPSVTEGARVAVLETIGYICEGVVRYISTVCENLL